jgi:hypothetical protein
MNRSLFTWSLAFVTTGIFSISAAAQLGGPSVCGKGAGNSRASVPQHISSADRGHSKISSLPPSTALEDEKLNALLVSALKLDGISVPGGDLKTMCSDFKDLGQCIAAMHVSKNLSMPFADLQHEMTGSNSVSLHKAIQGLGGHDINPSNEAKKAKRQTNRDLKTVKSRA